MTMDFSIKLTRPKYEISLKKKKRIIFSEQKTYAYSYLDQRMSVG
jgi:hypothetical protein